MGKEIEEVREKNGRGRSGWKRKRGNRVQIEDDKKKRQLQGAKREADVGRERKRRNKGRNGKG
jgi:hypothetical protein